MTLLDLTSRAADFERAVAAGDFFAALGVSEGARKLDIDVAAAHEAERFPFLAGRISAVANVLTHPERKSVYESTYQLRDRILQTLVGRYGPEFLEAIPDHRVDVWKHCCYLMRFDLKYSELLIGPIGAASLAAEGEEWIIDEIIASHVVAVAISSRESHEEVATREIWHAECTRCRRTLPIICTRHKQNIVSFTEFGEEEPDEELPTEFVAENYWYLLPACDRCHSSLSEPSEFDDFYTFTVPPFSNSGDVLRGVGRRTGRVVFATHDRLLASSRPNEILSVLYEEQDDGKDISFAEAAAKQRARVPWSRTSPCLRDTPAITVTRTRSPWYEGNDGLLKLALAVPFIVLFLMLRLGCDGKNRSYTSSTSARSAYQSPPMTPKFDLSPNYPIGRTMPLEKISNDTDERLRLHVHAMLSKGGMDGYNRSIQALQYMETAAEHQKAGRRMEAISQYELARLIWKGMSDESIDSQWLKERLGHTQFQLGQEYSHMKRLDQAQEAYSQAVDMFRSLKDASSAEEKDRHLLGMSLCNLASVLQQLGKSEEAKTSFREAIPVLQVHLKQSPGCQEAKVALQKALEVNPEKTPPLSARAAKQTTPLPSPSQLVGKKMPEFTFTDLDGKPITTVSFTGKVVVLQFWHCCEKCCGDLPALQKVYQQYKNDPRLAFLAISVDAAGTSNDEIRKNLNGRKVDLPVARASWDECEASLLIHSIPTRLVIDTDGVVRDYQQGRNMKSPAKLLEGLSGQ